MILILSQDKHEFSTIKIIDWLIKLNGKYLRINGEDLFTKSDICVDIGANNFIVDNLDLKSLDVKVVFNRRWLDSESITNLPEIDNEKVFSDQYKLAQSIKNEFVGIGNYMYGLFENAIWVPLSKNVNKLKVLSKAIEVGLIIPQTKVLTHKSDVVKMSKSFPIIVKSISDIHTLGNANKIRSYLTKELSLDDIGNLDDTFPPSLFQEKIEKEVEIRTFFFFGECYSIAIFSQSDATTTIDFRNYNRLRPNRRDPYQLPKEIEDKLRELMAAIELNTGSIDIVKTVKGEYVFLEVNPVGQFGMVDESGNYNLYEIIAKKLIELDESI